MSDNPQVAPAKVEATSNPAPAALLTMNDLAKQLLDLKKKVDEKASKQEVAKAVAPVVEKEEEIDWTKIEEKDVFDLSLPIPAIEQEIPDYLNLVVSDKNYITRWVHRLPERLGPCLVAGYSYVLKEDLDPNYPLPLQFDSEGHYTYSDVVCLKILKSRYYPAIRRNHEKSMAIHGKARVHSKLGQDVAKNPRIESALRRGAISFYDEEATEESGPDLEAVTL